MMLKCFWVLALISLSSGQEETTTLGPNACSINNELNGTVINTEPVLETQPPGNIFWTGNLVPPFNARYITAVQTETNLFFAVTPEFKDLADVNRTDWIGVTVRMNCEFGGYNIFHIYIPIEDVNNQSPNFDFGPLPNILLKSGWDASKPLPLPSPVSVSDYDLSYENANVTCSTDDEILRVEMFTNGNPKGWSWNLTFYLEENVQCPPGQNSKLNFNVKCR